MQEMQFAMMLLMSLLTVALVMLLPRSVSRNNIINRSRWLLASGTALIAIQFLLQYALRLRDMGITQAVMVNLMFFVPSSALLSISILNLQYQGSVKRIFVVYGLLTWIIVMVILVSTALFDKVPLFTETNEMRMAEYISAILYSLMQIRYTISLNHGNKKLSRALSNYFDYDTDDLFRWMKRSVFLLALVGVGAPLFIFSTQTPLLIYAFITLFSVFYLVLSFICYCASNDSRLVLDANENAVKAKMDDQETINDISNDERLRIDEIVNKWIERGGYLKSGITMHDAVKDMQIPRYQLAAWLKTTPLELFNPWLTYLRIEEAKRLLVIHPDWSNDTIANQCGFSSRSYFQQVFKKQTGMTPAQFSQQKGS